MKIISNVATLFMAFGLSIFGGMYLFGAAPLSVLGWLVCLPLFVGSTGHIALALYEMFPHVKDAVTSKPEGEAGAATAAA
jgi:hypothetical protein